MQMRQYQFGHTCRDWYDNARLSKRARVVILGITSCTAVIAWQCNAEAISVSLDEEWDNTLATVESCEG